MLSACFQSNSVPVMQHPHMTHLHPLLSYSPEAFSPQRASPGFSPDTGKQPLLFVTSKRTRFVLFFTRVFTAVPESRYVEEPSHPLLPSLSWRHGPDPTPSWMAVSEHALTLQLKKNILCHFCQAVMSTSI